jgi:hypothetical protein
MRTRSRLQTTMETAVVFDDTPGHVDKKVNS